MGQPKHIPVVDDDGDVRDVIVARLEHHQYRVSSVADGALMREFLAASDPVNCVILDAMMPGEGSASLILYLKESKVPVVIISGNPDAIRYAEDNDL